MMMIDDRILFGQPYLNRVKRISQVFFLHTSMFRSEMIMDRTRLNGLLDRIKSIELFLTEREEEVERQKLAVWKEQKVGEVYDVTCRLRSLKC